ncbi:MAG: helix-turn-helix domain-containing protein [Terriglobia bacterium]
MRREHDIKEISIEKGKGSVYDDLGYAASEHMAIKAELVAEIAAIIKKRGLTQQEAAKTLGLTQPRVSRLLKGQFRGVSERRLLDCLTRLGRDIRIVVSTARGNRASGRLTLHIA